MTGARLDVSMDDAAIRAGFGRLSTALRGSALKAIAVGLVEETQSRFERGAGPDGAAWAGLNPAYAAIKRGPGILRESRMLQRSVTSQVSGNRILVGSNRVYAAVHQFGATIKPKNAKALVFRLRPAGKGKGGNSGLVMAKSVTIPARPYLGFGKGDREVVMDVLEDVIARSLRS